MKRSAYIPLFIIAVAAYLLLRPAPVHTPLRSAPLGERPIASRPTLHLAQMTWMEVRDDIAAGTLRSIVPIGGIEQNGPYVTLEKHNLIVLSVAERAAKILGKTLLAPLVPLSPEGDTSPPTGHMQYPGTISLRPATLTAYLVDVAESLLSHGFTEVIFIADSGDAQQPSAAAAAHFANDQRGKVRFIPEFYNYQEIDGWVQEAGYREISEGIHDSLAFTAQLAALDTAAIRYEERAAAEKLSLNGVPLTDLGAIQSLGEKILNRRAEKLARSIARQ